MSAIPPSKPSYYLQKHIKDFKVLESLKSSSRDHLISKLWIYSRNVNNSDKRYLTSKIESQIDRISAPEEKHHIAISVLLDHRVICKHEGTIKFNFSRNLMICDICHYQHHISPRREQQIEYPEISSPKSPEVQA